MLMITHSRFSAIYGPTYRVSFVVCVALVAGAIVGIVSSQWLMERAGGRKVQAIGA